MEWFKGIFSGSTAAESVFALSLVIAVGIALGKIKIKGVSIGSTWILFMGIFLSHIGLSADSNTLHFAREIGLIFFVYLVSETSSGRVEYNAYVCRVFFFEYVFEGIDKAHYGRSVESFRVYSRIFAEREICPVYECVCIEQE